MDTPTLLDLRNACKDAGLSPYGNKDELMARLNAVAASELAQVPVVQDAAPVVTPDSMALGAPLASPVEANLAAPADIAATQLMQTSATVRVVEAKPAIIQTTPTAFGTAAPVRSSHAAQAAEVLDYIRRKFPQLSVKLDPHQEVFIFEGGRQGRMTTTIHQPMASLVGRTTSVADHYVFANQQAAMIANTVEGAVGSIGTPSMVYQ